MLNIGFITNNHYPRIGGLEYCTHYLAKHLIKIENVNAAVACGTLSDVPSNFNYSYPCYRAKSFSVFTPWLFKKNRESMIKRESINVLHGQMLHGGGYNAMKMSEKFNIPFVAQSHGSDVQTVSDINYGALLEHKNNQIIKNVIKKADKLIAVSSINKQNMIDHGALPETIEVIHNGIDIDMIDAIPFKNLRHFYGLKPDDFVIITVGRNKPVKRMELLFQALQKLKDYKSIKCFCVGPKKNLEQLVTQYGVQDQVVLPGSIPQKLNFSLQPPYPDLINLYRASNIFVSCSYVESFGMASADALACGVPIIIGKKHGIQDLISLNKSGWIMPAETPETLADIIISLKEKSEQLVEDSNWIKESVSHLKWNNIAKQTVDVYKSII